MGKIMYDYSKLLGRLKEKGFTQLELANRLGVSETTVNLSLGNKRAFKQDEIFRICELLDLDMSDIEAYFFSHNNLEI